VKPGYLAGVVLLAGCGYIGPVLPPALDIPARITDLTVAQYGDGIRCVFTVPALTTEGLPLKSVRAVEIRVGTVTNPFNVDVWALSAKSYPVPQYASGPADFPVPAQEWIGKEVAIVARATGPKGKPSEWSNLRTLPISQPLAAPADLKADNVREGVSVTWKGPPGRHYRLFRAAADEQPQPLDETDQPEYLDRQIEFGTRYQYFVQGMDGALKQSAMAVSSSITPVDEFAPVVPTGLTAEQGANSIDLSWERNTEPRFRGYNVYRSVDGAPFAKVASLITAPTYSDRPVEAGKKYRYAVSAVGVNDHESAQSVPFEITVQ
jgi:hypothetical protein